MKIEIFWAECCNADPTMDIVLLETRKANLMRRRDVLLSLPLTERSALDALNEELRTTRSELENAYSGRSRKENEVRPAVPVY